MKYEIIDPATEPSLQFERGDMINSLKTKALAHIEYEKKIVSAMAVGFTEEQAQLVVDVGLEHGILTGLLQMAAKGKLDWEDLLQTVYRVCTHDDERIINLRLFMLSVNQFIVDFCEMIGKDKMGYPCFDKYNKLIVVDDTVSVKTVGSLNGDYTVVRKLAYDGQPQLYIGYPERIILLYSFYPCTLEIIKREYEG